ncbi:MAG TPA: DNA-processing protein DprA, partial [bacterium]|nr:DNA-processing protein DprA [bacterium]
MTVDLTIEELSALHALADVPGIGAQRMRTLLKKFTSAQAVLSATKAELMDLGAIGEELASTIQRSPVTAEHTEKARRVKAKDITVLHFLNYNYPVRLKEIPDPPVLLYLAGEVTEDDEQAIAVVGTRASSGYGHRITGELTGELVRNGFTIVSGLARGIDTQAHQSALEAGGRTIAVLGSGIDNIYPHENTGLAREIAQRGGVCTEYFLGTP